LKYAFFQFENPPEVKATSHVRPTAGKCLHAQQNAASACCEYSSQSYSENH